MVWVSKSFTCKLDGVTLLQDCRMASISFVRFYNQGHLMRVLLVSSGWLSHNGNLDPNFLYWDSKLELERADYSKQKCFHSEGSHSVSIDDKLSSRRHILDDGEPVTDACMRTREK